MSTISGLGAVQGTSIQGLDLESALMAVQSNRANLLEAQLKDQIAGVQAKNDQISRLNQALGALNKMAAMFPSDAKADAKLDTVKGFADNNYKELWSTNDALKSAGLAPFNTTNAHTSGGVAYPGGLGGVTTKGQLDGQIQQVKSQIDSMSNSQQMDMLRLQSLSNKRNESFEIMTNFIKKMQDSRSAILGNMR